jgi:hypothetical protein
MAIGIERRQFMSVLGGAAAAWPLTSAKRLARGDWKTKHRAKGIQPVVSAAWNLLDQTEGRHRRLNFVRGTRCMAQAGWARWGKTRIDLLMNAQVDSSVRLAQLLVGEPRFLRVNTMTTPGMYALDGSKEIENLVALGNRKGSDPEILSQVRSRFLNGISAMDWKSTD